jgi:hypothetical protein
MNIQFVIKVLKWGEDKEEILIHDVNIMSITSYITGLLTYYNSYNILSINASKEAIIEMNLMITSSKLINKKKVPKRFQFFKEVLSRVIQKD